MSQSLLLLALTSALSAQGPTPASTTPRQDAPRGEAPRIYRALVACESADQIQRIAFDGTRAVVERTVAVGTLPTETEGPHGVNVSHDGVHYYVSIAHGTPFGRLCKHRIADDVLVGSCELGMFPATMQESPSTGLVYCVNFNLHGRMLPSTVSIVDPEEMVEVARTPTGPMPHGSRLSTDGLHHYSCAMMSGHLFEIDAATFEVQRDLQLDVEPPQGHQSEAKPTWVHPHPKKRVVYCALNGKGGIAEVDLENWKVARVIPTAKGPYNLEVTPDGSKIVVSCKTAGKIGVYATDSGEELALIESSRRVTHGVAITPDGRYAFVSCEGKGSEPGAVDVVDLTTLKLVASAATGLQAGGITLLP